MESDNTGLHAKLLYKRVEKLEDKVASSVQEIIKVFFQRIEKVRREVKTLQEEIEILKNENKNLKFNRERDIRRERC